MKTPCSTIERLESRIAPAGLIAVSVSAAGTLLLKNVLGQDGDEVVTITQLPSGAYQLTPGAGVALRIGGVDFTTAQTVEGVTGGMVAKLGTGNDQVVLDAVNFTKAVAIDLGDGNNALTVQNSALGGRLDVTTLGGNDTVTFGTGQVGVGGAVTLRLGAGNDTVVVSATSRAAFGAGLIIDAGLGDDSVTLGAANSTVDVLGAFQFLGGAGLNTLTAGAGTGRVSVLGAVLISGGDGADTITLGGARFTAGALTAALGAGDNTLTSTATDFFIAGAVKWSTGPGLDRLELNGGAVLIGGSLTVLNGDGPSFTHITPTGFVGIGGSVTVLGGKTTTGKFDISLNTNNTLNVNGALKVKHGDGDLGFTFFGNQSMHLGKGASVTHGTGQGNILFGSNSALISNGPISVVKNAPGGILQVFAGSGGDSVINGAVTLKGGTEVRVTLAGTITGALNMAPSPGVNGSVNIVSNGARPIHVGGAVNLASSPGAANTTTFQLQGLVAEGAVSVCGGLGADTLNIDNCGFFKSLRADLGAGADTFRLEAQSFAGPSTFFGPVTFLGGLDADNFLIGGNTAGTQAINFRALTILDGGDGVDTITIGTQATFVAGSLVQKSIP